MEVSELVEFLSPEARVDVRRLAVEYVVGLTASPEQAEFFHHNIPLFEALLKLANNAACQAMVYKGLVNLSSHETLLRIMVDRHTIAHCLDAICDPKFDAPDDPCMLLANFTRDPGGCRWMLQSCTSRLPILVDIFCKGKTFNPKPRNRPFTNDVAFLLQRLVSFTRFEGSEIRRVGAMGAIRNCCFDHLKHDELLGPRVNILPALLLPLAGPEEFDDDDMDGMCDDLLFLPPTKCRDPAPVVRMLAMEALLQLCALRSKRELLRARKVYPILREYHKWEQDEEMQEHCEKVVQILIADEDPTADNLKEYNAE